MLFIHQRQENCHAHFHALRWPIRQTTFLFCARCGTPSSRPKFVQIRLDNNKSDAAAAFQRQTADYLRKQLLPSPHFLPSPAFPSSSCRLQCPRHAMACASFCALCPAGTGVMPPAGGSMLNRPMRLTPRDRSPSGQTQPGLWQPCHGKYVREAESRERARISLVGAEPGPSTPPPLSPSLCHICCLSTRNRRASPSSWAKWGSGRLDIA